MTRLVSAAREQDFVGLPLIDLHDHLDGGLRPQTVIDLARECGYTSLPSQDPDDLAAWFTAAADSGSLEQFLQTFAHTVAVLQTPDALTRVAAEAVIDLARDGVAWAEIRMAPELCENSKLDMDTALTAMVAGLRTGEQIARSEGLDIDAGLIVCAMRQTERAKDVAALVRRHADRGVVGFDIAGPEAGFPPSRLAEAFAIAKDAGVCITVHAGEADGVESIRQALAVGAQRLGHGVRIIQDISFGEDGKASLGAVAGEVRDRGIALEICPTSNVQTGAVGSLREHPLSVLDDLGFVITINPDNRLMCGVDVREELSLATTMVDDVHRHNSPIASEREDARVKNTSGAETVWVMADIARWTRNAINASFATNETKLRLELKLQAWEESN